MTGSRVRTCVTTPILGTLHLSVNSPSRQRRELRRITGQRSRRPPRQSLGSAGGGSPASGRTCKDEARGTRRDRPGYVVLPDALGVRAKSGNERNHRHDYPAQRHRAGPVRRPCRQGERAVSAPLSPEDVVRKFFDCYPNGRPEDFDEVVAPDYLAYGHTPPGRGPGGARDDDENAVREAGAGTGPTIERLGA